MITITVHSYVIPDEPRAGFREGNTLELTVGATTTIRELTENFFSLRKNQISLVAVNNHIVTKDTVLQDGDHVALYPPLEGG